MAWSIGVPTSGSVVSRSVILERYIFDIDVFKGLSLTQDETVTIEMRHPNLTVEQGVMTVQFTGTSFGQYDIEELDVNDDGITRIIGRRRRIEQDAVTAIRTSLSDFLDTISSDSVLRRLQAILSETAGTQLADAIQLDVDEQSNLSGIVDALARWGVNIYALDDNSIQLGALWRLDPSATIHAIDALTPERIVARWPRQPLGTAEGQRAALNGIQVEYTYNGLSLALPDSTENVDKPTSSQPNARRATVALALEGIRRQTSAVERTVDTPINAAYTPGDLASVDGETWLIRSVTHKGKNRVSQLTLTPLVNPAQAGGIVVQSINLAKPNPPVAQNAAANGEGRATTKTGSVLVFGWTPNIQNSGQQQFNVRATGGRSLSADIEPEGTFNHDIHQAFIYPLLAEMEVALTLWAYNGYMRSNPVVFSDVTESGTVEPPGLSQITSMQDNILASQDRIAGAGDAAKRLLAQSALTGVESLLSARFLEDERTALIGLLDKDALDDGEAILSMTHGAAFSNGQIASQSVAVISSVVSATSVSCTTTCSSWALFLAKFSSIIQFNYYLATSVLGLPAVFTSLRISNLIVASKSFTSTIHLLVRAQGIFNIFSKISPYLTALSIAAQPLTYWLGRIVNDNKGILFSWLVEGNGHPVSDIEIQLRHGYVDSAGNQIWRFSSADTFPAKDEELRFLAGDAENDIEPWPDTDVRWENVTRSGDDYTPGAERWQDVDLSSSSPSVFATSPPRRSGAGQSRTIQLDHQPGIGGSESARIASPLQQLWLHGDADDAALDPTIWQARMRISVDIGDKNANPPVTTIITSEWVKTKLVRMRDFSYPSF